ncbi:TldD/PmbA family protein [Pseudanabaena mucicola]|uniref:TldD/PmbA family protein n=1 Tax=Pseudanabaena mucicola FACHB-723 TaxID=2692860 RepID=A0ABR7ZX68_9CYAN|nr:TldD/PmbA family protein [Pseudanabaena mucicola]MBD2188556.1 TldD/PmbA family protein [Pseudanabaena mucicola FACHB-723]
MTSWQVNDRISSLVNKYKSHADFFSIRVERLQGADIFLRSGKVETLSTGISIGGQVRACHRGGWGFASFNDLNSLESKLQEAIASAKWVGNEETVLAEVEPVQTKVSLIQDNPHQVSLHIKKDLCSHYTEILRSCSDRVVSTAVRYGDCTQQVLFANSEGTMIEQEWADWELRCSAIARNGDAVQTGRETFGSRLAYQDLLNLDERVMGAAQRAVTALDLPTVEGNSYTVVIDPILAGLFVHEAFGHLSEADMLYENPDMLETMSIGRKFGSTDLQIFDGAAHPHHRGSYLYDDEGVPATTTQLIADGVLVGRLHSRETAGKLGEQVTGNARCLDYHYPPIVRMTNTWIGRGNTSVSDLFTDIPVGVYAKNWQGGMTNGEMFTFTAGEAWMIRDGKIAEPVKDVTLSGNAFETLADIEAIGNDFMWDESGGCGKGGQSGLAVGCGAPSLRIKNAMIGGDANA